MFGLATSCRVHSSATFSFDASVGAFDAGPSVVPSLPDPDAGISATIGPRPDFFLRFERTECFGTCPLYFLTVDGGGALQFSTRKYVDSKWVEGCASKQLDPFAVMHLSAMLRKNDVFSLKNDYGGGPSDKPWAYLTVRLDGKTKTVKHFSGAHVGVDAARLEAIEDAIDTLTEAKHLADPSLPLAPCVYDPKGAHP